MFPPLFLLLIRIAMSVKNLNDFLVVDVICCRPTLHYLLFDLKNMHMKGVRVKNVNCTISFIHSCFPFSYISGPRLPML